MIAPSVRGIYKVDVSDIFRYREEKYGICVSVSGGRYLMINTHHRDMYDDFKINASDYAFLAGIDRFVACADYIDRNPSQLKQQVGVLSVTDLETVVRKINISTVFPKEAKPFVLAELSKALVEARLAT